MDHARWSQIEALFSRVIERPPAEREAFLDAACAATPELRAEVASLLESLDRAGDLFERVTAVSEDSERTFGLQPGARVGAYELVREIGQGGMGDVWLAERADDEFRRRVAIKFLASSPGSAALRRFRRERQILAGLDHPHIVRLLDGGTTAAGVPYMVMDHVDGTPIHAYCDRQRLDVTDRLRLFLNVCDAVHYAHQNLIVHCDLKPTNILVTADGTPKLLDFGIARLLGFDQAASAVGLTRTGMRVLTPEYASPEQFRGEAVTTATDVYALGVVLYRLLTGRLPYRVASDSPVEFERAVTEQEPDKPSTSVGRRPAGVAAVTGEAEGGTPEAPTGLQKRLRGDLDTIVLMALRKEPQRRYASVAQFADDLRRHLEGLPVLARDRTLAYRAGRFVRRHKAATAAAALVAASLIAGSVVAGREAQIATRERERAERRFNDVRRLASSFLFEFDAAIQNLAGATPARQLVVTRAIEYLDSLAEEAGDDAGLLRELAQAYTKVGDIQGSPVIANLGETGAALDSYRKALAISERLMAGQPASIEVGRDTARLDIRIGDILLRKIGDPVEALAAYERGLGVIRRIAEAFPGERLVRRDLAILLSRTGNALFMQGDTDAARDRYRQSLDLFEVLHASAQDDPQATSDLAFGYQKIADVEARARDFAPATEHFRRSLELFQSAARGDPGNGQLRREIANVQKMLADALNGWGRTADAIELYRESLSGIETLVQVDPRNDQIRRDLANVAHVLAMALAQTGRHGDARPLTRRSLAITGERAEREGASPSDLVEHAWVLLHGEPPDLRDPARALALLRRASAMANDRNPDYLATLALAYYALGDAAQGDEIFARALALVPASGSGATLRRELEERRSRFRSGGG